MTTVTSEESKYLRLLMKFPRRKDLEHGLARTIGSVVDAAQ